MLFMLCVSSCIRKKPFSKYSYTQCSYFGIMQIINIFTDLHIFKRLLSCNSIVSITINQKKTVLAFGYTKTWHTCYTTHAAAYIYDCIYDPCVSRTTHLRLNIWYSNESLTKRPEKIESSKQDLRTPCVEARPGFCISEERKWIRSVVNDFSLVTNIYTAV